MMTRVRRIFGSRAFYIVFSLLASFTIWLYVAYIENPDVAVNVKGIKVEFINQDYVTDRDLVITDSQTDTVSLRFTGKRNTVSKLTNTNLTATVDLADIKTTGVFQLAYTIVYPLDVNATSLMISNRSVDYISVTVDKLAEKDIPVKGTLDGGIAEGYQAEPIELNPNTVKVYGPQEILSRLSYAWVSVKRDNISKTFEDELPFTLFDEAGHEISSDSLTFSQDTIHVKIPVVMIKSVPLTVNLTPGAGANDTNAVCTITPSVITVSGDAEILNSLNQILLGTIDLSKFLNSTTEIFQIVLPNNTANLTGTTAATVTVTVSGLESEHLSATNIQVTNVKAGYTAEVVTQSLDVILRGTATELSKVTASNIRVAADLSDFDATTGTYSVLAKVYVDGALKNVGAVGEYKVTVKIRKA